MWDTPTQSRLKEQILPPFPIAQIENKVVVPKNHFLAEFDRIHLEQLSRLDCICLPSDVSPQLFSFMKQLSAQYHFNIVSRTDIRNFTIRGCFC